MAPRRKEGPTEQQHEPLVLRGGREGVPGGGENKEAGSLSFSFFTQCSRALSLAETSAEAKAKAAAGAKNKPAGAG